MTRREDAGLKGDETAHVVQLGIGGRAACVLSAHSIRWDLLIRWETQFVFCSQSRQLLSTEATQFERLLHSKLQTLRARCLQQRRR